ncbi:alginate lyase family protein [Halomonas sp. PR-M31]|uniref:alginate lyase family protein n=1 Tax=Halomonas sp. PR-M31 TaxID=1471202 RepID=UPI00065184C8|nr:alginate lyase family protein [Halomonas sp. PR-M31]
MRKTALLCLTLLTATLTGASQAEDRFGYRQGVLSYSKCLLGQRENTLPGKAYASLLEHADEALNHPLYSVVDKTQLPASGNRHDYFSFAPYWWPNSETDDGLPYVQRDGEYNMATKTNATDKQRMISFAKDVRQLALAYYFSDNIDYANKAARQMINWFVTPATRMAPNMAYAQAIPGRVDGRDIGIIDSRILIDVANSVELLRDTPALSQEEYRSIKAWYADLLDWLLESGNGREEEEADNNHGTWYDAQVVAFALFTDQPELARTQLDITRQRIADQFDAKGRQPEELDRTRPWHYSNFNLEAYARLVDYADRLGLGQWRDDNVERKLRRGFKFVAEHALQDASWPYQELNGFDPGTALGAMMAAALLFDDPAITQAAARLAKQQPGAVEQLLYSPFHALPKVSECVLPRNG